LSEVKAILAAIVALVFTVATLMLDHTVVMSTMRRKRNMPIITGTGWRYHIKYFFVSLRSPERLYGMAVGSGMVTLLFVLSGAAVPYVPFLCVPIVGAMLGLLIASKTEILNPVRSEEIIAGEAMGLTYLQIMREIVVPEGRPGILQLLNKRKIQFN
jgi:ABC-type amino acid transport system permease subunit